MGNLPSSSALVDQITPIKRDKDLTNNNRNAASPASSANGSFSGIHSSSASKRVKTIKFHDRFKGKIQLMNKDGHIGVVKTTNKPIEKVISLADD